MGVRVRLHRVGKNPKKRPFFRIGVFDSHRNRDGTTIEELGYYNPVNGTVRINQERIQYWIKNGALLTPTVKSLLKKYKGGTTNATA